MSNAGAIPKPGVAGGFAPLSSGLMIPSQYIPSSGGGALASRMHRAAGSSIFAGMQWQTIGMDTIDFDGIGGMSTATGKFTAPSAGVYLATGAGSAGGSIGNVSITKNGATPVNWADAYFGGGDPDPTNGYTGAVTTFTDLFTLAQGDTLALTLHMGSSNSQNFQVFAGRTCYLMVVKLS